MTFKMNSPQGKCILAMVREGDFAHPGEEPAIVDAVAGLPKDKINQVLDIGCGRGGTANWFHTHGWGKVVGIDIDETSINYAKRQYPDVSFFSQDVLSLSVLHSTMEWGHFDLIYLFNVFYALNNQAAVLKTLRKQCAVGAHLLICDYTLSKTQTLPMSLGEEIGQPIAMNTIEQWLPEAHWQLDRFEDWTEKYINAYVSFIEKLKSKQAAIVQLFDEAWYQYVFTWYQTLLHELQAGNIGGGKFMIKAI
ncbi:class I SAM-dependent methyltransferase [uncultured Shewanella sp.]|uniref:class I SAM-dependent methyltransferase n=1 Tax=uncultured Shewanella sp. TaxID=173975 RepID=UPI00261B99EB|nr:class I SAM-dependent methyltransferase [uncultured Shewanella sp.]